MGAVVPRVERFGGYDLLERIGVGALGEVFRAAPLAGGPSVALKRLFPSAAEDASVVNALFEEAELVRALGHPCICRLVDVGEDHGVPFVAFELVRGVDLAKLMAAARGPVPLDVALSIAIDVADGLAHAHEARAPGGAPLGIVHRDVSPTNVLVGFDGRARLTDFGIARASGRVPTTGAGEARGTLGYMAPEQLGDGPLDARVDVWGLGVCLWELVTGARLFAGPAFATIQAIRAGSVRAPSALRAALPPALDDIVCKALALSADSRYATASSLRADLAALADSHATHAGEAPRGSNVARFLAELFPGAARHDAGAGLARANGSEESTNMSDSKGGSDLDVFEGLAKKSARPAALAPPTTSAPGRSKTVVGVGALAPPPPPVAPPPAPTGVGPASTGLPPPSLPKLAPPPPPTSQKPASVLPPPAAPPATVRSTPPPPPTPPALPPPSAVSARAPAPLPPPAAPSSLASNLGFPDGNKASPAAMAATQPMPPPPPLAPPPAKPKASVEMDWDDEEESTHVFDKGDELTPPKPKVGSKAKAGAAAALLQASGGAAKVSVPPPAAPPLSAPPPPPVPAMPAGGPAAAAAAAARGEETLIRPRPQPQSSSSGKAGVILGAAALLVAVGLGIFMLLPKKGQLKIDVRSKSGGVIQKAEIFVDGQKKCDTAPCIVTDLEPGSRTIRVIAADFLAPDQTTETVEAGKEKAVLITVEPLTAPQPVASVSATATVAPTASASALAPTKAGLKIASSGQDNLKVYLDGAEKGSLPLDLTDLAPGKHTVKLEGGKYYDKLEQTVDLVAGETKDLGSLKAKVLVGNLTLEVVTQGAEVTLVSTGPKKVEKRIPDAALKSSPVKIDIDKPEDGWKVVATKKGFEELSQELRFEDGNAFKTVKIELVEKGKAPIAVSTAPSTPPGPATTPKPPVVPTTKPSAEPTAAPASGNGTLNINSLPPSKVLLDGKPLGSTPKVGVSVSAGSHTVTFKHPEHGTKSVTVTVKAGETKTAAVKF